MAKSILEPEQLTADLIESLKGKAFKGKNGFDIAPEDREIIRNMASILGHDSEELFNVAIEQGKDLDKINVNETNINSSSTPYFLTIDSTSDIIFKFYNKSGRGYRSESIKSK